MLLRDLTNEALFAWKSTEAIAFCPRCKSTNLKDSLYRVHDVVALLLGFRPLRCRCCHYRFRVWRLFGEQICRLPDPGTQMVLVRRPFPLVGEQTANFMPKPLPLPQGSGTPANDLSGSLMNLFAATNQFPTSQFSTGNFTRPIVRKRIVEAEFSSSLASAAVAVGQTATPLPSEPVNAKSGVKPSTASENRRKGDRPRMHTAARSTASRTPAKQPRQETVSKGGTLQPAHR